MTNQLFYGDNLTVLRDSIPDESVDPPFNSNASYNVLFKAPSGEQSAAQIEAFDDTWHWNTESTERAFDEVVTGPQFDAAIMLKAMRSALGENDMMAYLAMMAVRLIELHRVLKPTGSLYLHCDPTASHYLKILLDSIFGARNFVNEISWRRTTAKADYQQGARHFPRVRDVLLRYCVSDTRQYTFNQPFMDRGIDGFLHFRDADKRPQTAIISVKGGGIKSGDIRDLKGTMEREGAALGIFLTLNSPTREMEKEAASAGFYETGGKKFTRVQILTAAQVIDNRRPQVPFGFTESLKKASREIDEQQGSLL